MQQQNFKDFHSTINNNSIIFLLFYILQSFYYSERKEITLWQNLAWLITRRD